MRGSVRSLASLRGLAVWSIALGCQERPDRLTLVIERGLSGDVPTISLDLSLVDVVRSNFSVDTLSPDLVISDETSPLVLIADVGSFSDGSFAVLDRGESNVALFDSSGALIRRIGASGGGPGEFDSPLFMEVVGKRLVVFEAQETRTFTVLDAGGTALAVSSPPIPGDWFTMKFRGPVMTTELRHKVGVDDWARRLVQYDDDSFVYRHQPQEHADEVNSDGVIRRSAMFIRMNLDVELIDTIGFSDATPLGLKTNADPRDGNPIEELFFAPSPIFASGDGWYALGHGDSSKLTVYDTTGVRMLDVDWADSRHPVTQQERLATAKWSVAYTVLAIPGAGERMRNMSDRERRGALEEHSRRLQFFDETPQITAAYGAGSCLWVAGFDPKDFIDGTALTWIGFDVGDHSVRSIRLVTVDRRVLHFSRTKLFALAHDSIGVHQLERYELGGDGC